MLAALLNLGFAGGGSPIPGGIAVPSLIGLNVYEAIEQLQEVGIYIPKPAYGFVPSQISIIWTKSTANPGIIVNQSPGAGSYVLAGADVALTVADFPFSAVIDFPPDWAQRWN